LKWKATAQIAHLPVPQAGLLFCRPVRRQAGTKANAEKPKELFFSQRSTKKLN
jgi:hypothetical protein